MKNIRLNHFLVTPTLDASCTIDLKQGDNAEPRFIYRPLVLVTTGIGVSPSCALEHTHGTMKPQFSLADWDFTFPVGHFLPLKYT